MVVQIFLSTHQVSETTNRQGYFLPLKIIMNVG